MIAFSVVDLPAPLRPIKATTSPATERERDVEQDLGLAVGGVEAGDGQHESVSASEIDFAHAGVGADRGGLAGGDELAAVEHQDGGRHGRRPRPYRAR